MVGTVRKEYDFSKARRNPYARRLKRQVTIRLDEETIRYFNGLAAETGIPYQTLINLYLRDCAASRKKLAMNWLRAAGARRGKNFTKGAWSNRSRDRRARWQGKIAGRRRVRISPTASWVGTYSI